MPVVAVAPCCVAGLQLARFAYIETAFPTSSVLAVTMQRTLAPTSIAGGLS